MIRFLATGFGSGWMRPAPGTWGSLASLPLAWAFHSLGGPLLLSLAIIVAGGFGWWATGVLTQGTDDHDPSEIVIDEFVGQWIGLLPVSAGAAFTGVPVLELWPGILTAFIGFRFFDIVKPGPVGWADKRKDALGVMLDDVIAGVLAALVVVLLAAIAHGVLR